MKKTLSFILAVAIATFLSFHLDQVPEAQSQRQLASGNVLIIEGKIIKISDEYFIQGKTPANIFRILNPTPETLDRIIQQGRLVEIEARSVLGDNIEIEGIYEKPYRRSRQLNQ